MTSIKPIYLLAGGNWRDTASLTALMMTVLESTTHEAPRVAYVGVANGDDASFFAFARELFHRGGAAETTAVPLASNEANIDHALATLEQAEAIFISGGDVDLGMKWLQQHQLAPSLHALYQRGTLFFGLSAGSIMLGRKWVRWRDPNDDTTAELFDCMGIAPIVCDTHAERDDWEELQTAVRLGAESDCGYGIATDGVLRIDPTGNITALRQPAACYRKVGSGLVRAADVSPSTRP